MSVINSELDGRNFADFHRNLSYRTRLWEASYNSRLHRHTKSGLRRLEAQQLKLNTQTPVNIYYAKLHFSNFLPEQFIHNVISLNYIIFLPTWSMNHGLFHQHFASSRSTRSEF